MIEVNERERSLKETHTRKRFDEGEKKKKKKEKKKKRKRRKGRKGRLKLNEQSE